MSNFRPKTRLEKILGGAAITARSGLEAAVQAALERTKPLDVDVMVAVDSETGKAVITTDKTAAELFSAVYAGRAVAAHAEVAVEGEESLVTVTTIFTVTAKELEVGDARNYEFVFIDYDNDDGVVTYYGEGLGADDTVVLTGG